MDQRAIIKLIEQVVAPVMGDQLKEIRALKAELEHVKRQVVLLKANERGRRNRELVKAAEADDDDY